MMIEKKILFLLRKARGVGGKREGEFASPMEKVDIYPIVFFLGAGGSICCPASPPSYYIYIQKGATYKIQIHIHISAPGFPPQVIPRVTHPRSITVWSIVSPDPSPFVHLIGIMIINTIMSFLLISRVWDTLQLISLRVWFFFSFFFSPPRKNVSYLVSFRRITLFHTNTFNSVFFFFSFSPLFLLCTSIGGIHCSIFATKRYFRFGGIPEPG